jgi:hypothetical protein
VSTATRAEVLREIASTVLSAAELLAAWSGKEAPTEEPRGRSGLLVGDEHYLVRGDIVDIRWRGVAEVVPLAELLTVAAEAGDQRKADRLAAAVKDQPRAMRDAERYIRAHGDGGMVLIEGTAAWRAPEWAELRRRLRAVHAETAAWWSSAEPEPEPGEQLDLFDLAGAR